LEQEEQELRWSLGDWKYQGFNSKKVNAGWKSCERAVLEACMDEKEDEDTLMTPTQDRFMRAACSVMIQLESSGAFDAFKQTAEFKTYVADHDETEDESWERFAQCRSEFNGA